MGGPHSIVKLPPLKGFALRVEFVRCSTPEDCLQIARALEAEEYEVLSVCTESHQGVHPEGYLVWARTRRPERAKKSKAILRKVLARVEKKKKS